LTGVRVADNYVEVTGTALLISGNGTLADSVILNNAGYTTENAGNSTITNGTTSIAVTHGLSLIPTIHNVRIVGLENPTNDVGTIWISSPTTTQFTVNVEADPGASNWDFGWSYAE
jgi:hypothetical protein